MKQKEYTFKQVDGVSIEADVYCPLHFHGIDFLTSASLWSRRIIDSGPTISLYEGPVKNSLDAYEWVRLELPDLLKKEGVSADGSRIVVLGHSCGATLVLLTVCAAAKPSKHSDKLEKHALTWIRRPVCPTAPKAILDLFGMKYLQDPIFHTAAPTKPAFEQQFIDQFHKDVPPPTSGPSPMGPNGPELSNYRVAWMFNAIKAGTHLKTVVGDGNIARVDPVSLFSDASFPPTYFVHGTQDPLVDAKVSKQAHDELRSHGAESELVLVEGAGHGFDAKIAPGDQYSAVIDKALEFLKSHV